MMRIKDIFISPEIRDINKKYFVKGVFSYNFSTPGEYEVETNVIADFNSSSRNHSLSSVTRKVFDQVSFHNNIK